MNAQTVLGDLPVSQFIADHLHRLPAALPGSAQSVCEHGTWNTLGGLLALPEIDAMVVRDGKRYQGRMPTNRDEAQALNREGYTILVRHAEQHHETLASLAESFTQTFGGPANIHIYATPSGRHGFSWHYDAEDVFIMQTTGAKEYLLRKNTVNPWPLEETLPEDMKYGREIMPLMRVMLKAGDLLYIPCGYWHKADSLETGETAISLALGVMSRSGMDIFDFLRTELLESLLWRQRLPVAGSAGSQSPDALREAYGELIEQLAKDLTKTLSSSAFLNRMLKHLNL